MELTAQKMPEHEGGGIQVRKDDEANRSKTICENTRGLAIEVVYSKKQVYQFVKQCLCCPLKIMESLFQLNVILFNPLQVFIQNNVAVKTIEKIKRPVVGGKLEGKNEQIEYRGCSGW